MKKINLWFLCATLTCASSSLMAEKAIPMDVNQRPWDVIFSHGFNTVDESKSRFKALGFTESCGQEHCTFKRDGMVASSHDTVMINFDSDQPDIVLRTHINLFSNVPLAQCEKVRNMVLLTPVDNGAIDKIRSHSNIKRTNQVECMNGQMFFSSTPIPPELIQ